jgi:hypothetical protein
MGLALIALGFVTGFSCGTVQRKPRTSIAAAGGYSRVQHETFNCGDPDPIQRHEQWGGVAEVAREESRGARFGGRGVLLRGNYTGGEDIVRDPDSSPYWVPGLGGFGGYDLRYFGAEGGLMVLVYPQAKRGQQGFFFVPYARIRFGDYDLLSGEFQVGSATAFIFDTRLVALGVVLRQPGFELHAGGSLGGRVLIDQETGTDSFLFGTREALDLDFMFYFEGEVQLVDRLRLTLGGQIGEQLPMALLGLRYDVAVE